MAVVIDTHSPIPAHQQIADELSGRIARDELRPSHPLPSETHIRGEFAVSRATVRRAVATLRDRGLVFTVAQRGTFVSG